MVIIEHGHRNSGFTHRNRWFSIVILVYQRVCHNRTLIDVEILTLAFLLFQCPWFFGMQYLLNHIESYPRHRTTQHFNGNSRIPKWRYVRTIWLVIFLGYILLKFRLYPLVNKHRYRKSPYWRGNSNRNGGFSIAALNYQRGNHLSFEENLFEPG